MALPARAANFSRVIDAPPSSHHQLSASKASRLVVSRLNHNIRTSLPYLLLYLLLLGIGMPRKPPASPSSTAKSSATGKSTRDSSPVMASTPATAVASSLSSSPTRSRTRQPTKEESPAEDIVTQEMLKEESELHQQQGLTESSSQVLPSSSSHPKPRIFANYLADLSR